jgi:hypothetical protein
MTFIPSLKDSINSWITDVIGYIKTPTDSGGIGDDKHLCQITYNGIETGNNAFYGPFSNYYSLYNNSKLDIAGMSSYFDEREMMKSRMEYATLLKDSFPQRLSLLNITNSNKRYP